MPTDPAGHLVLWLVTRPEHKVRSPPSADVICRRHGSLMFRQLLAPLLAIASLGDCEAQAVHSDHFYVSNAADYVARHDYRVQVLERKPDGSPDLKYYEAIPYGDGQRLVAQNPNCCFVGHQMSGALVPECVTSGDAIEVTMRWNRRYRTAGNTIGSEPDVRHFGVRDDGSVCTSDGGGFHSR